MLEKWFTGLSLHPVTTHAAGHGSGPKEPSSGRLGVSLMRPRGRRADDADAGRVTVGDDSKD
jgi:hypothetical protein